MAELFDEIMEDIGFDVFEVGAMIARGFPVVCPEHGDAWLFGIGIRRLRQLVFVCRKRVKVIQRQLVKGGLPEVERRTLEAIVGMAYARGYVAA